MKKIIAAIWVSLFISPSAFADGTRDYLQSESALEGVRACMDMAKENGWNMSIVVIDRGEDVVTSVRMDGALPASYKGASLKAETALSWGMTTGEVNKIMEKNPVFKQFPGIMGIDGGVPVFSGKVLVGAVGVAGHAMQNDAKCAKVAAESMK